MSGKAKNGYERPLDLSHPKAYEAYKRTAKRNWTQEEARKWFVDMGIFTKSGRLTKKFTKKFG